MEGRREEQAVIAERLRMETAATAVTTAVAAEKKRGEAAAAWPKEKSGVCRQTTSKYDRVRLVARVSKKKRPTELALQQVKRHCYESFGEPSVWGISTSHDGMNRGWQILADHILEEEVTKYLVSHSFSSIFMRFWHFPRAINPSRQNFSSHI